MLVEGCVDVVEELVARFDCHLRGFGDCWPEVILLMDDVGGIVVAVERVESPQHSPACTELFGSVASVAADIRSDHRDLVDGCECNHFSNRDSVVRPVGVVVAEPVANEASRTCEGAAGYDQGSESGAAIEQGAAACFAHHGAKEVVGVVFSKAVRMDEASVDSEVTDGTGSVVDGVWWVDEVAVGQPHHGACSSNLSLFESSSSPAPYTA